MASFLMSWLVLALFACVSGQEICEQGETCAASVAAKTIAEADATNLMQFKAKVSRHASDGDEEFEAWRAPREDVEEDEDNEVLYDVAIQKDLLLIVRKQQNQYVSEEEMEDFLSRSKIFFKEPLSKDMAGDFCWKDTQGRGVGAIPKACPAGTEKGQFATWLPICYKSGAAMQPCPDGWRNDGLYCRLAEYGRGTGHFTTSGCEATHGKGNCVQNGLIMYPKCKTSFTNFGCCICRPTNVDTAKCKQLFGAGSHLLFGSSCYRTIDWSKLSPHYAECVDPTPERDAGLCYKKCNKGFSGVGPVCWAQPTGSAVNCGMGIAKSKKTCVDIISDQVFSVAKLTLNLASMGTAAPAVAAVTKAVETAEIAWATCLDAVNQMDEKEATTEAKIDMATRLIAGKTYLGGLKEIADANSAVDAIRGAAKFGAQFDPTGVAQVIGAYTFDKCSKNPVDGA
jgi:hypothetical protein